MFSLEHFIWLGISVVIIVGMFFIYRKCKLSYDTVLNIMLVVSVASETVKILCNMEPAPDGRTGKILDPGDLPFHLCSLQIFLMFALKFFVKKEETKEKMLCFMCPSIIIGAVMALLIPTVGVEFTVVQVYQFFIFHAFLIFFAAYILKEGLVKWKWRDFITNIAVLAFIALLMMWINSILSGVLGRVNFMYLVRPPMDNLPILNLKHGWGGYVITLGIVAISLVGIFHVIVTPIDKAKRKKAALKETAETKES